MLTAHLPSGYILARHWLNRWPSAHVRLMLLAGVVGAVVPDLDMLWFHLVDNRQTHHHRYFTHWPLLWLGLTLVAGMWWRRQGQCRWAQAGVLLCMAACVHLLLDSYVGDIWWLMPWVDQPFALFTVPARFQPWWLSFVLHWSFALELLIWGWAYGWYRRPLVDGNRLPY